MSMEFEVEEVFETAMGRSVAPEDLRPGDYVYLVSQLCEMVVLCQPLEPAWQSVRPIQLHLLPDREAAPFKVVDVCLPAVLVKDAKGEHKTLDARQHRFARLSDRFGRKAFKRMASKDAAKPDEL